MNKILLEAFTPLDPKYQLPWMFRMSGRLTTVGNLYRGYLSDVLGTWWWSLGLPFLSIYLGIFAHAWMNAFALFGSGCLACCLIVLITPTLGYCLLVWTGSPSLLHLHIATAWQGQSPVKMQNSLPSIVPWEYSQTVASLPEEQLSSQTNIQRVSSLTPSTSMRGRGIGLLTTIDLLIVRYPIQTFISSLLVGGPFLDLCVCYMMASRLITICLSATRVYRASELAKPGFQARPKTLKEDGQRYTSHMACVNRSLFASLFRPAQQVVLMDATGASVQIAVPAMRAFFLLGLVCLFEVTHGRVFLWMLCRFLLDSFIWASSPFFFFWFIQKVLFRQGEHAAMDNESAVSRLRGSRYIPTFYLAGIVNRVVLGGGLLFAFVML